MSFAGKKNPFYADELATKEKLGEEEEEEEE